MNITHTFRRYFSNRTLTTQLHKQPKQPKLRYTYRNFLAPNFPSKKISTVKLTTKQYQNIKPDICKKTNTIEVTTSNKPTLIEHLVTEGEGYDSCVDQPHKNMLSDNIVLYDVTFCNIF